MLCRASLTGLFFLSIGCVQSNNSGDSIQLIQRSGFSVEIPSDWKEGKGFKRTRLVLSPQVTPLQQIIIKRS